MIDLKKIPFLDEKAVELLDGEKKSGQGRAVRLAVVLVGVGVAWLIINVLGR